LKSKYDTFLTTDPRGNIEMDQNPNVFNRWNINFKREDFNTLLLTSNGKYIGVEETSIIFVASSKAENIRWNVEKNLNNFTIKASNGKYLNIDDNGSLSLIETPSENQCIFRKRENDTSFILFQSVQNNMVIGYDSNGLFGKNMQISENIGDQVFEESGILLEYRTVLNSEATGLYLCGTNKNLVVADRQVPKEWETWLLSIVSTRKKKDENSTKIQLWKIFINNK